VSFGPYKLTDYKPGQQWVLERNENYFNPSEVTSNLAKIIYKEIPSSANRVALLESGDIDMAWDLGAAELKKMETTPDVRVDNLAGTYLQWFGFTFGSEQTPQLGDSNVRFAIQYALPYDELLARPYLGLAKQMRCTVAPIYPGWDVVSKVWDRQQSLDKAKEYMAKSQYPTGFKTTIHFDINAVGQEESAIIIKSALAEIGIDAEIVKVQTADFFNLAFGGQGFPGLFIFRDMCGIPDVNFGTHLYIKTGHCCAPGKYSNKDVDALYDQAQRTIGNLDKRIELQRQIEDIAWNKDPMGAPMATLGFQMASRDNVTGWWWHNLQEIKWAHTAKA
jgi:peptide/nickel transport system substrate-binding protein